MELGTAVVIIAIILSLFFPAVAAFRRQTQEKSGENAISTGVIAARAYAPRNHHGRFIDIGGSKFSGTYSGVAILFTPANEMRLIENVPYAANSGGFLEVQGAMGNFDFSGYADIPGRDAIVMPSNVGVLGITRVKMGNDQGLRLLPPPFAVRFDSNGHLVAGDVNDPNRLENYVFYDGDIDGVWNDLVHRDNARSPSGAVGGTYVPKDWDPNRNRNLPKDPNTQRWPLPFDKIETVIGVLVFDKANFEGWYAGKGIPAWIDIADSDNLNQTKFAKQKWLLENSTPMFFSRYSGTVMR